MAIFRQSSVIVTLLKDIKPEEKTMSIQLDHAVRMAEVALKHVIDLAREENEYQVTLDLGYEYTKGLSMYENGYIYGLEIKAQDWYSSSNDC